MTITTPQLGTRKLLSNVFVQAAIISLVLTTTTYALAVALGWITTGMLNWFEVAAGVLNYAATFLCIKQKRSYALIGILGSAAWAYVFWSNNLLASAVVNAYLALTLIYGYWRWGKDSKTRPVHHLALKWVPVYVVATVAIYLGAVWITSALGGSFAFWDAAILVLTILAQLLQDQKVITVWIVWTLVNIVGVVLYWNTEIYFAMIQQVIFGVSNIWGWTEWRKTMKQEALV
jgi:nicotinamide mononucleotide transporter